MGPDQTGLIAAPRPVITDDCGVGHEIRKSLTVAVNYLEMVC